MQWSDEGLIIGVRRHGESSVIVDAMVAGRGRSLGLVRGGRSSKLAATIQPGNSVLLTWRARIEDHLGTFVVEPGRSRAAALMADRLRLYASQLLCEHLRLLPERDPHDRLLSMTLAILEFDGSALAMGTALARFELVLLDELGFGLDLTRCAATGVVEGLTHVSPKSGRAVSAEAAAPYLDRLLTLPAFLIGEGEADAEALRAAFRLTGHFLDLNVWMPRHVQAPAIRDAFIGLVAG